MKRSTRRLVSMAGSSTLIACTGALGATLAGGTPRQAAGFALSTFIGANLGFCAGEDYAGREVQRILKVAAAAAEDLERAIADRRITEMAAEARADHEAGMDQ